eukprot:PRCOL_00005997-RA
MGARAAAAYQQQDELGGGGLSGATAVLRDAFKKDEEDEYMDDMSPFWGIEKGAVLQESRVFHDPQLDARQCAQVITKLLYLINQGEALTKTEATEVFFATTKLFQSKDVSLRRMVYLMIKELSPSADEVIIVTSSLMKDMNGKIDLYRANAVRVLCKILGQDSGGSSLLVQIERYLKQAIVDKNPIVASSALCSGLHLLKSGQAGVGDVVKRWSNEIQEAVHSKSPLVQFHALALLHQIRSNDRLAISKLVSSLTRGTVLLVRYTAQVISESTPPSDGSDRPFFDFLESCLRHKGEMVIFEAARAIVNMRDVTSRELAPAVTVLQLFLSSSKPVLRFAAVRTLNRIAMTHPLAVTNCNIDMESLISDQNRSIATLAITTLLKTGNESSVDRLLKQITNFMSDIQDEFKIVVVEAVRELCLKFPQKHRVLMNFLSSILREEGGFEYKKAIVDTIITLIGEIPETKEAGLGHLCEFIEDCEFTYLSTQVLHILGNEAPKTSDPARYIRYIYNRVILENANVRASAVSALAKFGALVEALRPRVVLLLRRCLYDSDDEVRDRATLYLKALGEGEEAAAMGGLPVLLGELDIPLANFEESLRAYIDAGATEQAFDTNTVDRTLPEPSPLEQLKAAEQGAGVGGVSGGASVAKSGAQYREQLSAVPELAALGELVKSSEPQRLTEEDTEYVVSVIKHIFPEHIVFQFDCSNTIAEQQLSEVSVLMDTADAEDFEEEAQVVLKSMPYGSSAPTYAVMARAEGALAMGKFYCTLRFNVKEVDPATGEAEEDGFDDEYQLEDVEVAATDYIVRQPLSNFKRSWDELEEGEATDDYGLGQRDSLQSAVESVVSTLGLAPCEGSDAVPPNARSHTLLLAGTVMDLQVCASVKLGMDGARNVAMKLTVRAEDEGLCTLVHEIVSG